MPDADAERIVSEGSGRKSRPDNLFIPPGEEKALLSSLETAEGMIKNDNGRETQVQADAIRVKAQKRRIVWRALALCIPARFGAAGSRKVRLPNPKEPKNLSHSNAVLPDEG